MVDQHTQDIIDRSTPPKSGITLFESSVSATALTDIQEHVKLLPEVITNKAEFDTIYKNYQNVRKLRIALDKDSKEKVKIAKGAFTDLKNRIQGEEQRILNILEPIEARLLGRRHAWETKQKEIAEKKAIDLAAEQEKEFNRQQIIRDYDGAWEDNLAFDQKIIDDAERVKTYEAQAKTEARLNEERLKFEQEKLLFEKNKNRIDFDPAWDEAHFGEFFVGIIKDVKEEKSKLRLNYHDAWEKAHVEENVREFATKVNKIAEEPDEIDQENDECGEYEFICPKCYWKFSIE